MTVQVFLDTILLAWHDPREMAASFPAVMWFWLPFGLLQVTAGYVSTFVAQYTGAGRPGRVGPAVWQGIHFAVDRRAPVPADRPGRADPDRHGRPYPGLAGARGHLPRCLAFAALPMLIMAAINGFFSGRGQTWTVLGIEAAGTAVNVALAQVLIFGRLGFPELGIAGAGWATAAGSWASALLALALFLRPRYRREFQTLSGWRLERELFGRLMKYGGPAGVQVFLDVLVFHVFVQLVGRLGEAQTGGDHAHRPAEHGRVPADDGARAGGGDPGRPAARRRTGPTWPSGRPTPGSGGSSAICARWRPCTCSSPGPSSACSRGTATPPRFAEIAAIVPSLLVCVAIYSLADAVNVDVFLRAPGAGDTRFVSLLTFALAWPIMVVPTFLVVRSGGNLYWAWGFATAYIIAMAVCFTLRFRSGQWKSMRVIEAATVQEGTAAT